ncbi:MAG: peptidoglycan recognition protein family protein [Anaerolineae bacterium]|nr:peptidoglycan recognition protein family protein [Anaerolineae bacterium]
MRAPDVREVSLDSRKPAVISRAEWGARTPNHEAANESGFAVSATESAWYVYPGDLAEAYSTVAIHHSAAMLASDETARGIQDEHMDLNGWADIAYHFAIDNTGVIYEGREIGSRGASVAGHNTGTIGVVVMGNFEQEHPLEIQLSTLQSLVNWLAQEYTLSHLAAHGEFNPESVCPGQYVTPLLDGLARNAGLQRGTGGYVAPV